MVLFYLYGVFWSAKTQGREKPLKIQVSDGNVKARGLTVTISLINKPNLFLFVMNSSLEKIAILPHFTI
jgi:hypothetical protein